MICSPGVRFMLDEIKFLKKVFKNLKYPHNTIKKSLKNAIKKYYNINTQKEKYTNVLPTPNLNPHDTKNSLPTTILIKCLYRSSLDSGVPSEYLPGGIHSVAEAMLLFLESLAEPVIPFSFYEKALEATRNFSLCQAVIQELPDCHRNVFDYLINFQKELLKHSNMNGLDVKTLAHVFGIVLIRSPTSTFKSESSVTNKKKHTFIYHFLVSALVALRLILNSRSFGKL
ncbi:Type II inositol 1,4,5-trisphosphate 5-phosphatase [Armadillidium nasatum]|uniref:Type II inositol 1,4,5-trisphosphate 5-phosphatase n=1 Tax=Armadillidium nasatum TaxID=96803 RepID=A0A5N5T6K4_9CRUS|nr:Type II inositol 1,4,5-trisphosphate 5-phosphatase [Armadillidium nasatum]